MSHAIKLDKANIQDICPLTPMQEGMLFHYLMDTDNTAYMIRLVVDIKGNVDRQLFVESWNKVAADNEILRTVFRWEGLNQPVQVILKHYSMDVYFSDLSQRELKQDINLTQSPFKVSLTGSSGDKFSMVICYHHILYDGWSNGIILKEFFAVYNALVSGINYIAAPKARLADYIKILKQSSAPATDFWKNYLSDFVLGSRLADGKRDKSTGRTNKEHHIVLDSSRYEQLANLARSKFVTIASLFYTAWGILLQKSTNGDDVIFGTTISGRNIRLKNIEHTAGLFINTLPLRFASKGDETLSDLIIQVNNHLNAREAYENYSLTELKKLTVIDSSDEFFESLIIIENYPLDISSLKDVNGLHVNAYEISEHTHYDLTLTIKLFETPELCFLFNSEIFHTEKRDRIQHQFIKILDEMINYPTSKLCDLELITENERFQVVNIFNQTYLTYDREASLDNAFGVIANQYPDREILTSGNDRITYGELLSRITQLACILKNKGVVRGDLVGIMLDRSVEMIVSLFAVLKARAVYVPIDPAFPDDRIRHMISDSGISIMLSDAENLEHIRGIDPSIDVVNVHRLIHDDEKIVATLGMFSAEDPAYVIYTSGSTGKPKGVAIAHRNVINFIDAITSQIEFTPTDRILALTTISFDIFVLETFLPLIKGTHVVIASVDDQNDPACLCKLIASQHITMIQMTPSRLKLLMSYDEELRVFKNVKTVMLGGEALPESLFKELKKKFKGFIFNLYGPTETTVWSTLKELTHAECVTIGKPIGNTRIYILDKNNHVQPVGVPGELCIGGDGVGIGYFNNPALTHERFLTLAHLKNDRIYKTGDLAKWLPDGDIQCLGRIDNQVKIRGYRIEIDEIESVLSKHAEITQAVVIANTDDDQTAYLCAYYTSSVTLSVDELTAHLSAKVPEYMVPSYFLKLDEIPLTPNGKINRKALPKPELEKSTTFVSPKSHHEILLQELWAGILSVDRNKISINDNFFRLGGHSLKATSLVARIFKQTNIQISIKDVFANPTINEIAALLDSSELKTIGRLSVAEQREYYPVTPSQERLFVLNQMTLSDTVYNMSGLFKLHGVVDKDTVKRILKELVNRHESLRTIFLIVDGRPVQKVCDEVDIEIEYYSLLETTEFEIFQHVTDIYNQFIRPFDLGVAPLFRGGLISTQNNTYLLIDMHHIISDGTSVYVLINEFNELYHGKSLSDLRFQFKDYSTWINAHKNNADFVARQKTLANNFKNVSVLKLPLDFDRPLIQDFSGSSYSMVIEGDLYKGLITLSQKQDVSLFVIVLGAINVLLSKLTDSTDVVIGTTVAGRKHEEVQNMVGMFVNTLPVRTSVHPFLKVTDFLSEVKKRVLDSFDYDDVQLHDIIERIELKRDPSRNPLFDVLVNYQVPEPQGAHVTQHINMPRSISKFDLTFDFQKNEDDLVLRIEYAVRLFKLSTITRWSDYLVSILNTFVNGNDMRLIDIDILSFQERNTILDSFNATQCIYETDLTIHALFEKQVKAFADYPALYFQKRILTYSELDCKANQFARSLRQHGVQTGDVVGIIGQRSFELIVGIIGILKAGAAYLPLEKSTPAKRLNFMLTDSRAKVVVSPDRNITFENCNVPVLFCDDEAISSFDHRQVSGFIKENYLAYVIYTSGSTGNPKGVMVEHKQVVNLIFALDRLYPLYELDTYLFKTPCIFDVSVSEIFGWFLRGGSLSILEQDSEKDPAAILDFIDERKVTHVNFVPSLFNVFADIITPNDWHKLESVKYIFLAGEAVNPKSIRKFNQIQHNISLENLYGPTEATVYATRYSLNEWNGNENIPIGRPLDNMKTYIVDSNNALVGIGIEGELCISGDGVGRGYMNNDLLTAEKFITDPFSKGKLLYKTGDLVKWRPDGNIDFIGRKDFQVKVRGYRIELGEIEQAMLEIAGINEAVVVILKNDKETYLSAYYTGTTIPATQIKSKLAGVLPDYMVPAFYTRLSVMPFNESGKLNRKALPEPSILSETILSIPVSKVEKQLLSIWSESLDLAQDKIGRDSNFFELGGHSLKGAIIMAKILDAFKVKIPLSYLFTHPTLALLAGKIETHEQVESLSIPKCALGLFYPVTPSQQRLFVLQQTDRGSMIYNMPAVFEIKGVLDIDRFKDAFVKIVDRHEILRTTFRLEQDEPVQVIHEKGILQIGYIETDIGDNTAYYSSFVKPFLLDQLPLFRILVIKKSDQLYELLIDFHHIIFDGSSEDVLIKEFLDLYYSKNNGKQLAIQFSDYSAWLKNDTNYRLNSQRNYWINKLGGLSEPATLSIDLPRPSQRTFKGEVLNFTCADNVYEKLVTIANSCNATLHHVLFSAFSILLAKCASKNESVIGIAMAGRNRIELHDLIGMLVNTVVIRSSPEHDKRFTDFLQEVKKTILEAEENQNYPFDFLIKDLNISASRNRNPLFDYAFTYQDKTEAYVKTGDLEFIMKPFNGNHARFDLTLYANKIQKGLLFSFEYSTELFKRQTVLLLYERFATLLEQITNNPTYLIKDLDFRTDTEKSLSSQLLDVEFDF